MMSHDGGGTWDVAARGGGWLGPAVAAAVLVATAGTTRAAEIFTWDPRAVGLNGAAFTADTIQFADYDLIVQAPGGETFTEAGYLPIRGVSLAGQAVTPAGLDDPSGAGWGAYMRLTGTGTAVVTPYGTPGATYDRLDYQIVGFNGFATYGFSEDGNVAVAGTLTAPVTLASGSLIAGVVAFVPTSPTDLTIEGTVSSTVDTLAPGFATGRLDILDITIVHPPGEYSFISPTTTRVAAESGTNGTFRAAAPVPEPASACVLGTGLLLGAGLARRRLRRGKQAV